MTSEHVDVLIVGAGLSGISAACHLQEARPQTSFAIVESRSRIGGTWDLFTYPGVRSDSDMFTLAYSFRPWEESRAIVDGPSILEYLRETARERGVEEKIRFDHRVVRAEWSTPEARWTVEVQRGDTGETLRFTCGFLFACTGYYRYDEGYSPAFPGVERFAGRVVHPQFWSEDVDYAGKRVVVIGSGATAVTMVPALAERAAHVTMLQRSPSYILSLPTEDPLAGRLRRVLPARLVHPVIRWKNVLVTTLIYQLSRRAPDLMKGLIRKGAIRRLPAGYDVDTHFGPLYNPWDQRLCLVPDGDLFKAIAAGRVSVVTDRIATFTESGLRLASGAELEADVVVTATGLNMLALGGIRLVVDGREIVVAETLTYKGLMLTGVPNLAMAMGYTNASWTLKAELICRYVCRLLDHMDANGYVQCTPRAPDGPVATAPLLDLTSNYVLRAAAAFPKQGPEAPWRVHQNYLRDVRTLRFGPVDDGMEFSTGRRDVAAPEPLAA